MKAQAGVVTHRVWESVPSRYYGSHWTVSITLPAALISENGLQLVKEIPTENQRVFGHVGDLDVSASYPMAGLALNTSKQTTIRELTDIEGVPEHVYRMENMGISAGHVNAVPWCMNMLTFPNHEEVLLAFLEDHPDVQLSVPFDTARIDLHSAEFASTYRNPPGF